MKRETTCPECHRCGYHLCGCPEGERQWELAQMRADEEATFADQSPFKPIAEAMRSAYQPTTRITINDP